MGAWSKLGTKIGEVKCADIAHPWTKSCILAAADLFFASFIGSAGFFSALHILRHVSLALKKKKKSSLKEFIWLLGQSTVFASTVAVCSISSSCLLRQLLGRYYYYSMVLIPATLGGFGIFIESRKGKELATNTFANCALEYWLSELKRRQILKWNSNHQTMIFMVISSLLSYLLSKTDSNQQYFWVFIPPKVKVSEDKKKICYHKSNCWKHNLNLFLMYSCTGFVLQFLRLLIDRLKNPSFPMPKLLTPKTFRLAAFLGGYVTIYEATKCFLYRKEKKHLPYHDALAGFLAGSTFRFQPSLPIFNSGVIAVVQVLTEMGCQFKLLPEWPYMEIVFIVVSGLMYHTRILHSEDCPQLMVYIMSAITNRRADYVTKNYKNVIKKLVTVKKIF